MTLSAASTAPEIVEALWAGYEAEMNKGRWLQRLTRRQFLEAALPIAFEYHEGMFDGLTRGAATLFFRRLRDAIPRFPWAWIALFEEAFRQRNMNAVCWGAAARSIIVAAAPPGGARFEHHRALLDSFRAAAATGLMGSYEIDQQAAGRDVVTCYRAAPAGMHYEAVFGLDWCLSAKRAAERAYYFHNLGGIMPIAPLRSFERLVLVKAEVPKSAILAAMHQLEDEPCDFLIDCDKVPLDTVQEIRMPSEMGMLLVDIFEVMPLVARRMIDQSGSGAQV